MRTLLRSISWPQSKGCAILERHRRKRLTPKLAPASTSSQLQPQQESIKFAASKDLVATSRDGGTGRRSGLKIRRPSGHGGSTPPPGTNLLPTGTVEQPH